MISKSRFWLSLGVISASLVGSSLFSAPSYAQATGGGSGLFGNPGTGSSLVNLGALLGIGFISENGGTQLVVGANGDYKLLPDISVGGYFSYNSLSSPPDTSAHLITLAPEANYHFSGTLTGFRAGAKAGLSWITVPTGLTAGSPTDTTTSFVIGPHVGYDYPLGSGLSLGGEANFLWHTANDGFSAVNLLGNLKYWF